MSTEPTYIAIDLKSFYASVECVERRIDPLDVNLVVADESRMEKTICLTASPCEDLYTFSHAVGRQILYFVDKIAKGAKQIRLLRSTMVLQGTLTNK